jgi:hypothetical protein
MGEAARLREQGIQFKQMRPGEQIAVDLKNATPKVCGCGSEYFMPAVKVYTVSALLSPTGQELTVQTPVLVCIECKNALVPKETT